MPEHRVAASDGVAYWVRSYPPLLSLSAGAPGPAGGPLGGVEEQLPDLLRVEPDAPLGDAEDAGQQGLERVDVAADGRVVQPEQEADHVRLPEVVAQRGDRQQDRDRQQRADCEAQNFAVPADAPAYERLAGWFGRDPRWQPPELATR